MPNFPIVDSHLHLWDPEFIRYPWLEGNTLLNRPYLLDDYTRDCEQTTVEAMVFVQCEAEFSAFAAETSWADQQAVRDSRIKGIVAWAPLEKGRAVETDLTTLMRHDLLRGIRRIIQFEEDIGFCLRANFIEGVQTLATFGLSFDICVDYRQMPSILTFVEHVPDTTLILDHIGKPAIRDSAMEPWATYIRALAEFPNVVCKISGVANEAKANWSVSDLRPYIDVALSAFGFNKVMYGGDWPVALQAITLPKWVATLDDILKGVNELDCRKFWRDNAVRIYRLGI